MNLSVVKVTKSSKGNFIVKLHREVSAAVAGIGTIASRITFYLWVESVECKADDVIDLDISLFDQVPKPFVHAGKKYTLTYLRLK